MILPLLCASLIASAAVAPAVLPQYEDFSYSYNSMMVRKNQILNGDIEPLDSLPNDNGLYYFYIKFGNGRYYDADAGDYVDVDFSLENWGANSGVLYSSVAGTTYSPSFEEVYYEDGALLVNSYVNNDFSDFTITTFQCELSDGDNSFLVDVPADLLLLDEVLYPDPSHDATENDINLMYFPSLSPDGVEVVGEIVSILGAGIGQLGAAIGSGVSSFASSLAFDGNGNMSIYLIMVIALAGVALACGLTAKLFNWLTSLGN